MRDLSLYTLSQRRIASHACHYERPKAVILDVDGSLCDITTALPKLFSDSGKDFDAFHDASRRCPPYLQGVDYAQRAFNTGHKLVVVTGRMRQWRDLTRAWLGEHLKLPYDGPFMRDDDDHRPSDVLKREIYTYLINSYDVRGCLEDDPKCIEMFTSLGVKVEVGQGNKNWSERQDA